MSLMVGTVLAKHELTEKWLGLQLEFLEKTTTDFEHCAYANSNRPYETTNIIGRGESNINAVDQHLRGILALIEHFKTTSHTDLLVIDSDAWPVRRGWQNMLPKVMGGRVAALPIRFENLEQKLHSSILYCKGPHVDELDLQHTEHPLGDVMGDKERDICCLMDRAKVLPMLRTNRVNVHPMKCGIYLNLFYHHAAGSRGRAALRASGYYAKCGIKIASQDKLVGNLFANPHRFIKRLMW